MSSFEETFPSLKGKCVDSSGYGDLYDSDDISKHTLDKQRVREAINRATHPNQLNKKVVIKAELLKELGLEDE